MKKISFLLIAALLSGVTACQKDSPKKSDELTVEPTLTFEGNGGRLEVAVASDYEWQFEGNPDWLTIEPFLDRTGFYATAAPHGEDTERTATITLTNGKTEQKITVTQGVVEWYDFVEYQIEYQDVAGAKENDLAFPVFRFSGSPLSNAVIPEEDCWRVWVAGVTNYPTDMEQPSIEIQTGVYEWSTGATGGGSVHDDLPFINGLDLYGQNFFQQLRKNGNHDNLNKFGEGSEMVIEKEGDEYLVTVYLVSEADGTIFKGRYQGELIMDNPYQTGLASDWDFGTISSNAPSNVVGITKQLMAYNGVVGYSIRFVEEGLSRKKGFDPTEGSGIYITGDGGIASGNGYLLNDGTYTIMDPIHLFDMPGIDVASEGDMTFGLDNNPGFWVFEYVDGEIVNQASLQSGTVKITRNSTEKTDDTSSTSTPTSYTIEIDAVESLGHSVKGTVTFDAKYQDMDTGDVAL